MARKPLAPPAFPAGTIRKRIVVQLHDDTFFIAGIFDNSIHAIQPQLLLTYHARLLTARLVKVTTRAIWYREQAQA